MRIVKLSGEVFGFDTIEACKAYFESVLPWQKGEFGFAGEGHKIAKDKLKKNENILFSYDGKIVAIAKADELLFDSTKANGIRVKINTLKIFKKPISTLNLEKWLNKFGYRENIYASQGWNIINGELEKQALEFLKNEEWKVYGIGK